MYSYREQLEGAQLFRIRRLRRLVTVLLLVIAIVLSVYGMALEGASFMPLYLPIGPVMSVCLVIFLLASITSFAFRTLEIRHARRDSQRFLIIKNSIRRSRSLLTFTLILLFVMIAVILVANASLRSADGGTIPRRDGVEYSFSNPDVFGVARFQEGTVRFQAPPGHPGIEIAFFENGGIVPPSVWPPNVPYDIPVPVNAKGRNDYRLQMENLGNQDVQYEVSIQRTLLPELVTLVPVVLVGLVVVNGAWFAYARPLRQKYEASSIYSARYVEGPSPGERTYADYHVSTPPSMASPYPSPPPVASPPMVPTLQPIRPALEEPPAPPDRGPTHAELMEQGSRLFNEGQFEEALARYDEALEMEPQSIEALLAGSVALLRLGRKEEALGACDRALELDPRNPRALGGKAEVLEAQGQWARAAETWAEYLQVATGDVDAGLRRAEAILNTGDRAAAVKALEDALFVAPSDPRIRARIDSLTVNIPALLSRALVASASGQIPEALASFDQILAAEPDNVNALVGKGVALRRAGDLDRALAAFDAALAKQPGNSAALRAKGAILEEREDFDGALDVYDGLLAWNPRDPEVWAMQGSVLERLGEPEEALASYGEALKLDPNNPLWKEKTVALESSRKGQEQFLEELFTLKGVGPARVRALLAAGYKTAEAMRNATEDEIAAVKGITRAIAREVYQHFHLQTPSPTPPPPPSEPPAPSD